MAIAFAGKQSNQPTPAQTKSGSAQEQKLAKLESDLKQATDTIAELQAQIEQLESRPVKNTSPIAVDPALAQRIAALEQQIEVAIDEYNASRPIPFVKPN